MKPKPAGTINPCASAYIYDSAGNHLATTLDAPNPIAYAFKVLPNAVKAIAFYQYFGEEVTTRESVEDRFNDVCAKVHGKFLTIK
jgi:hypothetical protein